MQRKASQHNWTTALVLPKLFVWLWLLVDSGVRPSVSSNLAGSFSSEIRQREHLLTKTKNEHENLKEVRLSFPDQLPTSFVRLPLTVGEEFIVTCVYIDRSITIRTLSFLFTTAQLPTTLKEHRHVYQFSLLVGSWSYHFRYYRSSRSRRCHSGQCVPRVQRW